VKLASTPDLPEKIPAWKKPLNSRKRGMLLDNLHRTKPRLDIKGVKLLGEGGFQGAWKKVKGTHPSGGRRKSRGGASPVCLLKARNTPEGGQRKAFFGLCEKSQPRIVSSGERPPISGKKKRLTPKKRRSIDIREASSKKRKKKHRSPQEKKISRREKGGPRFRKRSMKPVRLE